MQEADKKYLKLRHKFAYGSGDMATHFCYSFLGAFVLIYLTDAVGLNAGIIGTLMMASRIFDGVTDVLAGTFIDRTRHKWGKARPWMIWTIVPVAVLEVMLFSIPQMSQVLQYIYFFIVYTLLNDIFYTMNNAAYSTLAVLITKSKNERVQLGAFRYIFTMISSLIVTSATMLLVMRFGGGISGWRTTAIIYAALFTVIQLICVLPLKEVTEEESATSSHERPQNLWKNVKYVAKNKYFLMQLTVGILFNCGSTITGAVGIFYMQYLLGDAAILGLFSLTMALPMIIGLIFAPALVKRLGIYKTNLYTSVLVCILDIGFIFGALQGALSLMLLFNGLLSEGLTAS